MLPTEFLDVASVRTRYADQGRGDPAVVLLHGFPENLQSWRKVLPELARDFRTLAPDLVGCGRTGMADWDYSCKGVADFIRRFLDARGVGAVHLVGTDTGSMVALAFAALFPERTGKLVLFSGTGYMEGISAPEVRLMMLPVVGDIGFPLVARPALWLGIRKGFWRPERLEKEALEEYLACFSSWRSRRIALRMMREMGRGLEECMTRLREKPPDTLVLWPEHERFFHAWVPERLRQDLQAGLEYVPDAGHFLQEERPDFLGRRIGEFLRNGTSS